MSKAIPGYGKPVTDLVKALGLDPEKTYSLKIDMSVKDAVRLEVGMFLSYEDVENFTDVIRRYHLEAIEDKPEYKTTVADGHRVK
jgi:hypothetical protein